MRSHRAIFRFVPADRLLRWSWVKCYNLYIYKYFNIFLYTTSLIRRREAVGTRRRQRGVALITAVMMVALATLAAAAVLASTRIALHRAENLRDSETEWWYALGVESWVRSILERDREDNQTDSLEDAWAQPVDYLPVDHGSIRGQVIDQQGLFNLNNLGLANTTPAEKAQFEKYAGHFERLLQTLGTDSADEAPPNPRALISALRDWIDPDDQPTGFDGAEDYEYLSRDPPYRAANRPLESVSELLAIKGFTPKLYARLLPYVTALPRTGTAININTAPEPVLLSLVRQPSADLRRFTEERLKNPADEVDQSLFEPGTPPVAVASQFFMLRAEVFIGSGRLALYSFYYRPAQGAPLVLGRSIDAP
jgi:general secretion pathway protein K